MWMGMIFKIQNKVNDHTFGIICKSITIEIEKILVNTIRICPKIIRSWISRVASLGEEMRRNPWYLSEQSGGRLESRRDERRRSNRVTTS
jgi:hypothetical protein